MDNYVEMKNKYTVKDKLTLLLLGIGMICFGVIFPDSLSTHIKLVHFSAHFGMSFLLAFCFYLVCTVKMRVSKKITYTILVSATLFIGVIYKYWEIASQGQFERFSFNEVLYYTGVYTSMSQNLSGLMGAMLLIEGLLDRNLIMSVLKSGNLHLGPAHFQDISLRKKMPGSLQGSSMPSGSLFSPDAPKN